MAQVIRVDDLENGYVDVVNYVLEHGEEVSPRGLRTKEVQNLVIELSDSTYCVPQSVGRDPRLEIGAAETAQIVSGASDLQQLVNVTSVFSRFSDDAVKLAGGYGPRVYDQLKRAVKSLVHDPDTRQAGVIIWRSTDPIEGSRDVPCTVSNFFSIRDDKLNLAVTMRSNDLFRGLTYDAWMFTRLQQSMAWALGIEPGTYTHHAVSAHVYESDFDAVGKLQKTVKSSWERPVPHFGEDGPALGLRTLSEALECWDYVQSVAEACVVDKDEVLSTGGKWYNQLLTPYKSGNVLCSNCRYVLPHTNKYFNEYDRNILSDTCLECY